VTLKTEILGVFHWLFIMVGLPNKI